MDVTSSSRAEAAGQLEVNVLFLTFLSKVLTSDTRVGDIDPQGYGPSEQESGILSFGKASSTSLPAAKHAGQ